MRQDQVWRKDAHRKMLNRLTPQRGARACVREPEELGSLAELWNLKPTYLPGCIIRRPK